MTRRALIILVCLLAGGCTSSVPEPRPLTRGFHSGAGVSAPYEDGRRHLIAGRYGLAIERFGQALGTDRRSLDALNGLAIAYAQVGRFDIAQVYFERALEIDAFSAPTLNNYGRALLEQGRLRDAKPFLDLALLHAARGEGAVVAANVSIMNRVDPPAVVKALRDADRTAASNSHRLVRLAANHYRLETPRGLAARPEQMALAPKTEASVVIAAGAGGPGLALASAVSLEALGLGADNVAGRWFTPSRSAIPLETSTEAHAASLAVASGKPM